MTNHFPNEQDALARQREREGHQPPNHVPVTNLVKFVKVRRSQRLAAEALGCSGGSISGWLNQGSCPKTIDLACQYLLSQDAVLIRVWCPDRETGGKVCGMLDLLGVRYDAE